MFDLSGLDSLEEMGILFPTDLDKKKLLKTQSNSINTKEEISWRQKSKHILLKEGYMNSSYFHRLMNARKREHYERNPLQR